MLINRHAGILIGLNLLGLLLIDAGAASAQRQPSLPERLGSAKAVKCEFPLVATGNWTNGEPHAALKTLTPPLRLGFVSINADEGSAQMVGGYGAFDIIARNVAGTLHFIQMYHGAPLYMTTIFAKESHPGKLKAAHSRHEMTEVSLPGYTSSPEQYYGECEITE